MSFKSLKKEVLLQVAEDIGADVDSSNNKDEIIAAIAEKDFQWEDYKVAYPDPLDLPDKEEDKKDEPKQAEAAKEFEASKGPVLLRMTRGNQRYEIRGYRFSRLHPFMPVEPDDADYILNNVFGFRVATPQEVEAFYS